MICDRQHACLHENLTELEQCRRLTAAPSRAADSREFRVTTKDPAQGRQAAPRRRIPALSLFLPILALAFASPRSEEHTSELQSLMRISYAVFCLKKKNNTQVYSTNIH